MIVYKGQKVRPKIDSLKSTQSSAFNLDYVFYTVSDDDDFDGSMVELDETGLRYFANRFETKEDIWNKQLTEILSETEQTKENL